MVHFTGPKLLPTIFPEVIEFELIFPRIERKKN
jgi:hypothetical protein